jgi:glycosyltransferase 2 family protein
MKIGAKQILQYLLFIGIGIFLLWFVLRNQDIESIKSEIKGANLNYIYGILALGFASIAFRAWRWQILIEPVEKKPRFINTFFSIFIGYGVNFIIFRLGEFVRCVVLAKYEKISVEKLTGTMVAERLFDFLTFLIVAILTFALEFNLLKDLVFNAWDSFYSKLGNIGLILIGIVGVLLLVAMLYFAKKINQSNLSSTKVGQIILNIKEGVTSVFKMKKWPLFLLHTVGIQICWLFMTYLGFLAFNNTSHLGLNAGLSVLTLGSLGFIVSPGGTGGYQAIVSFILTTFYNINDVTANAYSMLSWALNNAYTLIGAVLSFLIFPLINVKQKTD